GAAVMAFLVLLGDGFNLSALMSQAQTAALDPAYGNGKDLLVPMQQYGASEWTKLSFLSLSIALVAGPSGLPHVLMRFYTVPTAKEARRSAVWAIALVGVFFLITLVLGMGAAKLVGPAAILAAPGAANSAAPLLALVLGGEIFMGVISGVAFATILAVVAGLTITASASFAHDVYNSILKDGKADPEQEVKVARITSVVIGVLAILGGIVANGQNIAFLISLAFAVAASANLPSILYTMYWKRFNTRGSVWSIYTGLISSVVLIVFSPSISGSKAAMLGEAVDFAWFPLTNPALVSVPLAFLAGYIGTITSKVRGDEELAAEMEVRSMTGAGAGEAIAH
ncbi:MAG TPA: cation acetate symporter, partial [Propionibacterium sp.]|nr:cation acetate symporter [Propionibacterium sp.]